MGYERLLYITAALPPTRVPEADHTLYQCLRMAESGVEVHVLTRAGQNVERHSSLTIHEDVTSWSWRELPTLVTLIRRIRPDAVMISFLGSLYGYRTMPTMIPLVVRLLAPSTKVLVQFANLGQGIGIRSRVQRFLFRRLGKFKYGSLLVAPHAVVALSEEQRTRMRTLAPSMSRRTTVIPCSSQIDPLPDRRNARTEGRRKLGVTDGDTLVTFFGRLYPQKGIEQLIEAVADLRQTRPELQLALVGGFLSAGTVHSVEESYEAQLKSVIEKAGATDFVRFSGEFSWDGSDASQYLFASDIAVLPFATGIHLHNSSLAAVCVHGVPVTGTRAEVSDPALQHEDTVYFLDGSSPADIAKALDVVLSDVVLRQRLAAGSQRLGTDKFDGRVSTSRILDLLGLDAERGNRSNMATSTTDRMEFR